MKYFWNSFCSFCINLRESSKNFFKNTDDDDKKWIKQKQKEWLLEYGEEE